MVRRFNISVSDEVYRRWIEGHKNISGRVQELVMKAGIEEELAAQRNFFLKKAPKDNKNNQNLDKAEDFSENQAKNHQDKGSKLSLASINILKLLQSTFVSSGKNILVLG